MPIPWISLDNRANIPLLLNEIKNERSFFTYRGLALFGIALLAWEKDQFALILLKTLDILLKRFHGHVSATVINRDANGTGLLFVDSTRLKEK